MVELTRASSLIWMETVPGSDEISEKHMEFCAELDDALREMDRQSLSHNFLLGQVLRSDGFVLATVAPNAARHVNAEATRVPVKEVEFSSDNASNDSAFDVPELGW